MQGEWLRKSQDGSAVVFVHGVLSSGEACWRNENGTYWPTLLINEASLESMGIYVFTYETNFFSGSYSLDNVVDALKEFLGLDKVIDCRQIIFVCHSMGGIVVRKYFVDRAVELIEGRKQIGLFLVASPSLGAYLANWLYPLARLLGHKQAQALRFSEDNDWLSSLNKNFSNRKQSGKPELVGKELVEDKFIVLRKWLRKQVVPPPSGTIHFGESFKVPESDHFSIAKPADAGAVQHRLLVKFISDCMNGFVSKRRGDLRARVKSGLELDRIPQEQKRLQPNARLRFVNAAPLPVPSYFEDRNHETHLIGEFIRDPAASTLTIYGRGGLGKTALVCRVLKGVENNSVPEAAGAIDISSVVYINCTRATARLYPKVLSGVLLTLDRAQQAELKSLVDNPESTVATIWRPLISKLPPVPTVILLDNFEDLLEADGSTIRDAEILDLIRLLVEMPQHTLKIVITTRIVPNPFWGLSPNRHKTISLEQGIPSPHAELVLRKLDADGSAGFKNAVESTLTEVVSACLGFPRALEAFYSIKKAMPSRSIVDLIADVRLAAHQAGEITRVIVGEAYSRLSSDEQKALQVLAIYGRPVSITAIEFVLEAWAPVIEGGETLNKLSAMHFVRREGGAYYLHPIDREHAKSFLSDSEKSVLRSSASDYYREISLPREKWKTIADLDPHFEQFRLRIEEGDEESAASILEEISEFLDERGAFEQMSQMAESLKGIATEERTKIVVLKQLAGSQWRTGRSAAALETRRELVRLLKKSDPWGELLVQEGNLVFAEFDECNSEVLLGDIRAFLKKFESMCPWDQANLSIGLGRMAAALSHLGYLTEALAKQKQATQLATEYGTLDSKEAQVHNLGSRYFDNGEVLQASQHFRQALRLGDENGNPLWKANHLGSLSSCASYLGHFDEASDLLEDSLRIRDEIGDLGGTAEGLTRKVELLWIGGHNSRASAVAMEAFQLAKDLRLTMRVFRRTRAEAALMQGNTFDAFSTLTEVEDTGSGERWDFDCLLGTVFLQLDKSESAHKHFDRALEQCDLWLSRSGMNRDAAASRVLAQFGIGACNRDDALASAIDSYCALRGSMLGAKIIANLKRRLEQLGFASKSQELKTALLNLPAIEFS